MPPKSKKIKKPSADSSEADRARLTLEAHWKSVVADLERDDETLYLENGDLREAIAQGIHHKQVAYRYCLLVQVLGKLVNPEVDALCLQRGKSGDAARSWDARSFASKVVAPFVLSQENVLGTSADPYVGNAMRVSRMLRDDVSKKA